MEMDACLDGPHGTRGGTAEKLANDFVEPYIMS